MKRIPKPSIQNPTQIILQTFNALSVQRILSSQ